MTGQASNDRQPPAAGAVNREPQSSTAPWVTAGRTRRTVIRALALTWRAAWLEAWSNKRGFWSQVALMCTNNAIFVVFWVIFFREVRTLRGWDIEGMILLLAVLTTVAGVVLGLLHNVRRVSRLASDGGLDAALSLPVPTLPHLAARRVEPVSVGDLFFGLFLFVVFGQPTPGRALIFLFGVVCATSVTIGFFLAVGSLGFWSGQSDTSDVGLQALLLFAHYPVDVYTGVARLFLYVVMPAGFISTVPAGLLRNFDPRWAALAVLAAVAFLSFGSRCFAAGLRRYTSGAAWTDA